LAHSCRCAHYFKTYFKMPRNFGKKLDMYIQTFYVHKQNFSKKEVFCGLSRHLMLRMTIREKFLCNFYTCHKNIIFL
jgi:hypothetical protein